MAEIRVMTIPRVEIQRGILLEHLDGVEAEINKHYTAIDMGDSEKKDEHYIAIDELINAKFTLNDMLQKLNSTQCVEPTRSVFTLNDYKQNMIKYQQSLAEADLKEFN
jgi:hypothetical protein